MSTTIGPMIRPWLQIAESDEEVIIRHGDRAVVFSGPGAKVVVPAIIRELRGGRSEQSVVEALPEPWRVAGSQALDRLRKHGLLIEAESGKDEYTGRERTGMALSEDSAGQVAPGQVQDRLARSEVVIHTDLANAGSLGEVFRSVGFGSVGVQGFGLDFDAELPSLPDKNRLLVAAPRTSTHPGLSRFNTVSLSRGLSWTQLLPYDGSRAVIGPLFIPGQTGCMTCFQIRRRSTLDMLEEQRFADQNPGALHGSPHTEWTDAGQEFAVWGMAAHLLAIEALAGLSQHRPLAGRLHTVSWRAGRVCTDRHRLFRVPRCPDCGPRDLGTPQPWAEPPMEEGQP